VERQRQPVRRTGPRAALSLIASRNFGPYFAGNALSATGTWFQALAAQLLIWRQTHSGLLLGVLAFATFVPLLVLAPWTGAAADRFDRKRLVVAGQLVATVLATALAVLAIVWRREPRRLVVPVVASLIVAAGAVAIRGSDLDAFARFLGAKPGTQHAQRATKVQTYAHRTLLVWLGWQIFEHHPALGVGWEGSAEPANFMPYIPAAKRHFPNESPLAFPSPAPDRRYGVQNSWVQALADLGPIGLLAWAGVFLTAAWRAYRRRFVYPLLLVCVLAWLWSAQGYVAGIPLDALTFLGIGLAARA
jgi:O-antigen ligase